MPFGGDDLTVQFSMTIWDRTKQASHVNFFVVGCRLKNAEQLTIHRDWQRFRRVVAVQAIDCRSLPLFVPLPLQSGRKNIEPNCLKTAACSVACIATVLRCPQSQSVNVHLRPREG